MDWRKQARKALREYPKAKKRNGEADQAVISSVEFAMQMQDVYPNANERRLMVELVYFRGTHTMYGAARICHYAKDTVQKWAAEIMSAVYVGLISKGRKD